MSDVADLSRACQTRENDALWAHLSEVSGVEVNRRNHALSFQTVRHLAEVCQQREHSIAYRSNWARLGWILTFGILPSAAFAADNQYALNPAADQASRIGGLWWIYLAVLGTVWGLVMAVLLRAVFRSRNTLRVEDEIPLMPPPKKGERWLTAGVTSAVAVTTLILLALLFIDYFTSSAISSPAPPDALRIKLTGHQWWWEVCYQNDDPSKILVTANELHIPTGKPVKFELDSVDVIHSFWVPNLHGKKDLIPGHPTSTWFVANRPGTYFGQCAEFCGPQHAHMRLTITADPPEQFAAWMKAQS